MTAGHLILADGAVFSGESFGYEGKNSGELVFNTSMTGYQEILTDPSYYGQIVCMTYPQIGNYGVNHEDVESRRLFLSGFIVKEASSIVSNYRAESSLSAYLIENKIPALQGIDTRKLVRHIRERGSMPALLVTGLPDNIEAWKLEAKKLPTMEGQNFADVVSCGESYLWEEGIMGSSVVPAKAAIVGAKNFLPLQKLDPRFRGDDYKVLAFDFGIKQNILRLLATQGCAVKVVPANYSFEQVIKENPDGVFLSNGPGDPETVTTAITTIKKLLGKIPIFGICLGHQLLGLALGAKTYKLKFGHHGGNQPVMDLATRKVEITAQNHGFAIDGENLPADVEVTHINLNDQTVEGIRHQSMPAFGIQYHPEASPGPHDSQYLFGRFIEMMEQKKHA